MALHFNFNHLIRGAVNLDLVLLPGGFEGRVRREGYPLDGLIACPWLTGSRLRHPLCPPPKGERVGPVLQLNQWLLRAHCVVVRYKLMNFTL
jgi:hypothetical protein